MRINILGLGESLSEYTPDGNITIGVNDIYRHFKTHYLVVMDPPNRFAQDRLDVIRKSTPLKFFTPYYDGWRSIVQNLQGIQLSAGVDLRQLDERGIFCHSNNSVYVACIVAYKMGAREIVVYGADFRTHPNFHPNTIRTAIDHYSKLYKELKRRGVTLYVCSSASRLSEVLPIR